MIAAYVLDTSRSNFTLPYLAQINLDLEQATDIPDGFSEDVYRAMERADFAFQLAPKLRDKIREDDLTEVYSNIEMPLVPVLADIELAGMKVDTGDLNEFSDTITEDLEKLREKIYELAGREFNIGSPKQVGEVFEELNISTGRKTATGQVSTSRDVLDELAQTYEIAKLIIDYREIDKLKATYADALPKMVDADGRVHGCLSQTVAATGRLSSTDPNLQNIPVRTELGQKIREAFIPEKGNKLISADYSQLELRILAHITQDPIMLEAYKNNEDIHAKTARLVFGVTDEKDLKEKRRLAKIVNFGIAYAVEAFGLSQRVGPYAHRSQKGDRGLLRHLQGHQAIYGRDPAGCPRARLCHFPVRPPAISSFDKRPQLQRPLAGRARGHQYADPGHGQRHRQDRDAPGG